MPTKAKTELPPRPTNYPSKAPWPIPDKGIYWDNKRALFEVQVRHDGKTHRIGRFETLTRARGALDVARGEIATKTFVPPAQARAQRKELEAQQTPQSPTLKEYAHGWMRRPMSERNRPLSPGTIATYKSALDAWIIPNLGHLPLGDITRADVKSFLAVNPPRNAAGTLRALFKSAAAAEIPIKPDALLDVKTPKAKARSTMDGGTVLSVGEVARIAAEMPDYGPAVEVAAWCALRIGEALGLQRQDIDLTSKAVHVRRQWSDKRPKVLDVAHGGTPDAASYCAPKDESYGAVPVFNNEVWQRLLAHLDTIGKDPATPLFTSAKRPAQPVSQARLRDLYREAAKRAGIQRELDFHDLRHSGATWFGMTGASLAAIKKFGRWKDDASAMRYQHADNEVMHMFGARMGR